MAETAPSPKWVMALTAASSSGLLLLAADCRWTHHLPAQAVHLAFLALSASAGYALARLVDLARQGRGPSGDAPPAPAREERPPDKPSRDASVLLNRARLSLESRLKSSDPPGTVCPACRAVSASKRYALEHTHECRVGPLAEIVRRMDPSVGSHPGPPLPPEEEDQQTCQGNHSAPSAATSLSPSPVAPGGDGTGSGGSTARPPSGSHATGPTTTPTSPA